MTIPTLHLSDLLGDWSAFYGAVAQVSGSLIGLLFVSLSMRAETLRGPQNHHLRELALQTFSDFLSVLVMSLLLLVPHIPNAILALTIGAFAARNTLKLLRRLWKLTQVKSGRRYVLSRFGLSLAGNLLMISAAKATWNPQGLSPNALGTLLVAPMILLMMAGSNNALHLLLREVDADAAPNP